ncbi:MAG: TraR/DksA C4-type zinc finger protein [Bacillaceae bacterium]
MLSSQQKQHLHGLLINEKNRLEKEVSMNDGRFSRSEKEWVGELSSYDNHPADMGSELFELEKDLAIDNLLKKELEDVNRALQAMEQGTYGICAASGEEIPYERLLAVPTTLYSIEHVPDYTPRDRPVEEDVMSPSVRNYTLGVEQDAEDTWQDVARYGSSDTPADFNQDIDNYSDTFIHSDEPVGYVEDLENVIGTDMYGKNPRVIPSPQHNALEEMLDEYEWRMLQGELENERDWYD